MTTPLSTLPGAPLALIPVEAIGSERTMAFVCGALSGGLREVEVPVYPRHPYGEGLREHRVHVARLSLREAAKALGILAAQLTDLECGRATLSLSDWDRARRALTSPVDKEPQR